MRVAVIGANGQLGHDVCSAFSAAKNEVVALDHSRIEISSGESVRNALESIHPNLVINTAALPNVDKCETEAAPAFAVNALGARNVAQSTEALGATLIHISTDYVFDGLKKSPYTEGDAVMPLNVYGNTKLSGEYFVRGAIQRHFLVRVSGIYGHNPCRGKGGLNFVERMLKLAREQSEVRVVDDEMVTPTPTSEIAKQLVVLSATQNYGLYHASSEGSCSWYDFAAAIFSLTGTTARLARANPSEFPARAPRPKYSVMENAALKKRSLNVFSTWQDGLANYLAQRKEPGSPAGK